ncbi:hypothetical protein CEE37_11910 [candidate division LCP-89 bacterium B3_LCP]|uniref:Uncharacterized protein n=1 Tax=candidate division LCP-89 bacterium B3_LCP TaxID=2012998 RepID=A0A532UWF5_UNCL8|nr:MAG: hypothetical protein CEE37_11910 [candidate division LCP-89 bacterium B3_LCP]
MISNNAALVFILIFLLFSGGTAIVLSLVRIFNPEKMGMQSDSSLQTKFFRWKAPIGLTYGVLAILLVVAIVWIDGTYGQRETLNELTLEIEQLKKENDFLREHAGSPFNKHNIFTVKVGNKAKSILGGKILITRTVRGIKFRGISGISLTEDGLYEGYSIKVDEGDKFFIKTEESDIWGVNVLDKYGSTILEFYKIQL